jgi:ribosomal-protein-alanine N-acetyltransferase
MPKFSLKGGLLRMAIEAKRDGIRVVIRAFRPADAGAVTKILEGAREAADWSEESLGEAAGSSGGLALVSEADGEVAGFLLGRQAADEAEILNLGVAPGRRRRGDGERLLGAALDAFQLQGVSRVFLEVRQSNEAGMALYLKHGFAETGRRPGYYRNPKEAAILMERKLTG